MFLAAGRHIEVFRQKAEAAGKPLPITINMGLDPAIYIGACFEALPRRSAITSWASPARCVNVRWSWFRASASRRKPSPAPRSLSKVSCCPACASEKISTPIAATRCRNFGYCGGANPSLPVIKVKAVTMRNNAILQTTVGPGKSIPPSPACQRKPVSGMPSRPPFRALQNVYAHTAGGGKFLGILQVKNVNPPMKAGRAGRAAGAGDLFRAKNIILVDEDVDIFDSDDILWAMTTRMQGTSALRQSPAFAVTSWIRPRRRNTARRSVEMASAARPFLTARSPGAEIAL